MNQLSFRLDSMFLQKKIGFKEIDKLSKQKAVQILLISKETNKIIAETKGKRVLHDFSFHSTFYAMFCFEEYSSKWIFLF